MKADDASFAAIIYITLI